MINGFEYTDNLDGTFTKQTWKAPVTLPTAKEQNPLSSITSRLFVLERKEDESGVSGAGVVAEGIEFSTGWCALSWMTSAHSVGVYPNIKELLRIHGHNGRTEVKWLSV